MVRILLTCLSIFFLSKISAQELSYTCPRDTVLGCSAPCLTLKARFPDLRDLGDNYTFENATPVSVCRPYDPPEVIGPSTNLNIDDNYSAVIPIGFPFRFYGTTYPSVVVSTNGYLSFDISLAASFSAWTLDGNVPNAGYDGALVMGPWHDLDPGPLVTTSPTKQIKYNIVGTAPTRKWVLSFYKVPLFGSACNALIENTHQIVLHETTGIIEVFIQDKQQCPSWNDGKAMVGLQDITKTKGIVPPGRGAVDPPWGTVGMNEVWRFIPTGGAPLYRRVELLNSAGAVIALGDTTRVNINTFETTFPNICPPSGTSLYVIKTTYQSLANPTSTIYSLDTINVIRQAALPMTATMTPTTCGGSTGSVTATANGTGPYQFSLDGGTLQPSPTFNGVSAGNHTLYGIDVNGCNNTITINVTSVSQLPSTVTQTPVTCTGVNNATITVTPTAGQGPYSFSINGGTTTQPTGLFSNLAPGTYTISFVDANLCTGTTGTITIAAGTTLSGTRVITNTTCAGANDGSITVTPNIPGSYNFVLTPGPVSNTTGIFPGLAPGTYSVQFTSTVNGCSGTISATVAQGSTIPATWIRTNETCSGANDGTIQINPSAAGAYTFTLNPGNVTNTTGLFIGLSPGIFYNVVFTNTTSGCGGQMSNLFVQAATATITGTQTHTNATCPGVNDGTITVSVTPAGSYTYTLTPGNVTNTTGLFTGLPADTYSVSFENGGGCGNSLSNIIVGTGAPGGTTTATVTNALCTGVDNGSITVTPPATGGPFIYSLTPGPVIQNNNPVFTNLAPGNYTITYSTAAGCGGTVSPNPVVNAQASPTTTATATATECSTAATGTITVAIPAAGGPFTYMVNPGNITQSNPVFTGLGAGTYTVQFSTAAGCIGTVATNPVITALPNQTTSATATATTCSSVNNGTITVTPPSTGGPFTYTITPGGTTNSTGIFTGLAGGTYNITFTTAAGCTGNVATNQVVATGAALTTTAIAINTTCTGVNDGIITVTPPAIGGPFTYTLNPGNVTNTTGIFTGLSANTYTITFLTSLGCTGSVPVNPVVAVGTSLTTTATTTSTTCPGVDDGIITVNPLPNGAPFTYTLNPGNISNATGVFPNLPAGTYSIAFLTGAGCTGSVPVNPVVSVGAVPTTTATTTNTTCPGVDNGTIIVTPPPSGSPFTYTINPGAVTNSTGIFPNLPAANYTVTFTTALGCLGTVPGNTVVATGATPTTTATVINTTCSGVDNGNITVTSPAGSGPFSYTLNPGAVTNATGIFPNLSPGSYTINFTTPLGCVGTVSGNLNVIAGAPLSGTVTPVSPVCANINDGTITINPTQPGVYTYILNPGLPTQIAQGNNPLFTGLAPGSFTYSFTNSVGCIGSGTVSLSGNSPLAASVISTRPLCNGNANGIINIAASGGVAPYQYALSPFTNYQNGAFTGLTAGSYTIRIRDNAGCTKDSTIILLQPAVLVASATTTAGTCNGNDGNILIAGNGGTPAYEYSIDAGTSYQTATSFTVSGGSYPGIRVRDQNGCIANAAANVTLIDDMSPLYIGNDTTICAEQSVTFQPQVSPQATVFVWMTYPDSMQVSTLDDNSIRNATASPLDTVNYILNAQWGVCSRIDTIQVNVLRKPVADAGKDTAVCFDNTIAILRGSATNLSGSVNFSWSDTTNLATPDSATTVATLPVSETFTLTVTDNYGCGFSVTDTVRVTVQPPVPAFAGNDTIAVLGQPHQMLASGGVSYSWAPAASLNLSTAANPLATLTHDQLFVVTVTDEAGCVGSDQVFVQVYEGPEYYVPNAFSPNNDGLNDIFRAIPAGISYTEYFRVFNRYGELLFETNQWLKGWDGTYRGKAQPAGTYVWSIKGLDKYGKVREIRGTVLLIR